MQTFCDFLQYFPELVGIAYIQECVSRHGVFILLA